MLTDPDNCGKRVPYFRAWPEKKLRISHHPLKRSAIPPTFRGDIFNSAGIKPGECNFKEPAKANLSDLRASIIINGAFRIALTNDPSLHLRFNDDDQRPTLLLLDSRTILRVALLDLTGLMSYVSQMRDTDSAVN